MENPGPAVPPTYQPSAAQPPRRSNPWLWLGACGGCGCLLVIVFVGLMIAAFRTNRQPPPVAYVGQWAGQDGTVLEIASDGSASYRKGGNYIQGGGAVVDERRRTLRVHLGVFRKAWTITDPPHEVGGVSVMSLDGVLFRKGGEVGGGATEGATGALSMPSDAEVKELTARTLVQYNQAARTGDFSAFIPQVSAAFRQQVNPEHLMAGSRALAQARIDSSVLAAAPMRFDPAPTIDKSGVLEIAGTCDTTPRKVAFHIWYTKEGPSWKVVEIQVFPK